MFPMKECRNLVAIASSTGGPQALQGIIPKLPADIDAAVVVIQHMPVGFTHFLAERLDSVSKLHVKEAEDGEVLSKGVTYIAKAGVHLTIQRSRYGEYSFKYMDMTPRDGVKPNANYLYESLIDIGLNRIVCTVLTGMGSDGTEGIAALRKKEPILVIAQDEKSSVVYGMPRSVSAAGLVDEVLPLDAIADSIIRNISN